VVSIEDSILEYRLFGIRIGYNVAVSFRGVMKRTNMNKIPTHISTISWRSLRSVIAIDLCRCRMCGIHVKMKIEPTLVSSMTLKELEPQLLALSDSEKDRVVQLLSQPKPNLTLGIEKTPGVCGGSACVAGTRITVWGLVESQRIGYSEADLLTSYPTLSATNLANAWAYATAFPDEIEAEIAENNAVMDREI
jgi:uncharacterized protein (DUF433 family)